MKRSTWILFLILTVAMFGIVAVSVSGCGTAVYLATDMGGTGGGGEDSGGGKPDDSGVQVTNDLSGTTTTPVTVVGSWLSTGANLAPGFTKQPFNVKSIVGVFKADSTYSVTATDSSGKTTTSSGTWTSMPSSVPGIFDEVQNQTQPSAATAKGIYKIDDTVSPPMLTLEGIQTSPSLGASPPTAQGGFGSTMVNGAKTSDWVQKYVRQ